MDIFNKKKR